VREDGIEKHLESCPTWAKEWAAEYDELHSYLLEEAMA